VLDCGACYDQRGRICKSQGECIDISTDHYPEEAQDNQIFTQINDCSNCPNGWCCYLDDSESPPINNGCVHDLSQSDCENNGGQYLYGSRGTINLSIGPIDWTDIDTNNPPNFDFSKIPTTTTTKSPTACCTDLLPCYIASSLLPCFGISYYHPDTKDPITCEQAYNLYLGCDFKVYCNHHGFCEPIRYSECVALGGTVTLEVLC
jgi:hypothetical protein